MHAELNIVNDINYVANMSDVLRITRLHTMTNKTTARGILFLFVPAAEGLNKLSANSHTPPSKIIGIFLEFPPLPFIIIGIFTEFQPLPAIINAFPPSSLLPVPSSLLPPPSYSMV